MERAYPPARAVAGRDSRAGARLSVSAPGDLGRGGQRQRRGVAGARPGESRREPDPRRGGSGDTGRRVPRGRAVAAGARGGGAAFLSRHGSLTKDAAEIAVAEIPARGRRFREMTQAEVLEHARAAVAPGMSLEDFVLGNVADYDRARGYTAELRRTARPF